MKIAIPHWQGRVSPVFDVSAALLIVEIDAGVVLTRRDVAFDAEDPRQRVSRLTETGADTLVCGAISKPLEMAVEAAGIEVIPQICGNVENVLAAFISGQLGQDTFLMPGCCGRRRRFRGGANDGRRGRKRRRGAEEPHQPT